MKRKGKGKGRQEERKDFSKVFDTVRHSTLLAKMAALELPIPVYNWLVDFFCEHAHRTMFSGEESSAASISASIIQHYSGVGRWTGSVHCHSRRPETIAPRQFAREVCRRHVSCRPISQCQHAPAGGGQHSNMGDSERP